MPRDAKHQEGQNDCNEDRSSAVPALSTAPCKNLEFHHTFAAQDISHESPFVTNMNGIPKESDFVGDPDQKVAGCAYPTLPCLPNVRKTRFKTLRMAVAFPLHSLETMLQESASNVDSAQLPPAHDHIPSPGCTVRSRARGRSCAARTLPRTTRRGRAPSRRVAVHVHDESRRSVRRSMSRTRL